MEIDKEHKQSLQAVDWYIIYDLIAAKQYRKLGEIAKDIEDNEVLKNIIRVICESLGALDEEWDGTGATPGPVGAQCLDVEKKCA